MLLQGDVMLRALRFMDSMIQRDTMQKAAFLNDLTTFWDRFDDRVLRLKVYTDSQFLHLMHEPYHCSQPAVQNGQSSLVKEPNLPVCFTFCFANPCL